MQANYTSLLVLIAYFSLIAIILTGIAVFVVLFSQRRQFRYREKLNESEHARQLLQTRMEMQEQTLYLVSQELHDNIGQLLSSTKIFLAVAEQSIVPVPAPYVTATQTLSRAIKELRALSKSFNSEWLNQFDLIANLQQEAERLSATKTVALSVTSTDCTIPLAPEAQIVLFRVIQEAMQNSMKHAKPSKILIDVSLHLQQLQVAVEDDGVGFTVEEGCGKGLGTLNMQQRVALLKGTIVWTSAANEGTSIAITIPIGTEMPSNAMQKSQGTIAGFNQYRLMNFTPMKA